MDSMFSSEEQLGDDPEKHPERSLQEKELVRPLAPLPSHYNRLTLQYTFYLGTGNPKIKTAFSASLVAGCGHGLRWREWITKIICATPNLC